MVVGSSEIVDEYLYYVGCWYGVSRVFFCGSRQLTILFILSRRPPMTILFPPTTFFRYVAWVRTTCGPRMTSPAWLPPVGVHP